MLRIAVVGRGHLGRVTAACLASHHQVYLLGDEQPVTDANGRAAAEPGLDALESANMAAHRLFVGTPESFVTGLHLVWLCEDLPVGTDDRGDVGELLRRAVASLDALDYRGPVAWSSQVPVGTTAELAARHHGEVVYIPENLRRGHALSRFRNPDRVVVGTPPRRSNAEELIAEVLKPFTTHLLVMPWAAAEMVKHAINTYLAACIVLANEIGAVCDTVGVNRLHVEAGLRSDKRIGYEGPLTPGGPIRGGTLLRDVQYLSDILGPRAGLISAIHPSNAAHLTQVDGDAA